MPGLISQRMAGIWFIVRQKSPFFLNVIPACLCVAQRQGLARHPVFASLPSFPWSFPRKRESRTCEEDGSPLSRG